MKRWAMLAFLSSLVMSGDAGAFQNVMGTGKIGTVPVWTLTGTIGSTGSIDGTASGNLFIVGPTPWIDLTAIGGKGDTQTNTTGSINGMTVRLGTGSSPQFTSTAVDGGKTIAIAGAGIGAGNASNGATTGATGTLACLTNFFWQITYVSENGSSVFTS